MATAPMQPMQRKLRRGKVPSGVCQGAIVDCGHLHLAFDESSPFESCGGFPDNQETTEVRPWLRYMQYKVCDIAPFF